MADTLKFGPEWLRNLSSDTHCRSQSPTAPTARFKLAEHRYSKEEMLALFSSDLEPPSDLRLTPKIFVGKALQPLGLTDPTEAEQKLLSQMSSNNTIGQMRPPPPGMRVTSSLSQLRNSESIRKTKGSGRLDPIYYRSSTVEDDDFARTRHFNREPWDDSIPSSRGRGLNYSGRSFDEPSDVSRSMAAENWRGPKKKWNDEDTGNWRKQFPSQKPSNRSWREPWENSRIRTSDDPFKEKVFRRSFSSSHAQNNHYDEEPEQLPEWSTDDFGDVGTFDATGAFMSLKELERIEEQRQHRGEEISGDRNGKEADEVSAAEVVGADEMDGKDLVVGRDGDLCSPYLVPNGEAVQKNDGYEDADRIARLAAAAAAEAEENSLYATTKKDPEEIVDLEKSSADREDAGDNEDESFYSVVSNANENNGEINERLISSLYGGMSFDVENLVDSLMASNEEDPSLAEAVDGGRIDNFAQMQQPQQFGDGVEGSCLFPKQIDLQQKFLLEEQFQQPFSLPQQQSQFPQQFQQQQIFNPQQLQHFQQHPQQQQQQQQQQNYIKGFVAPDHEDAYKWFYRDPQGDIQGPFTQLQMSEWFSVGYFNMALLVKQGCDHNFLPIGTLVKIIGSNPFQIPYATSAIMSHLKTQAPNAPEQSFEMQQSQQLSQQLQQLQLKQQQQQQLDQMKIMQLMQMHPRNELLSKLSTLQLLQTLQQQQQLHQNNSSRPLLEALSAQSSAPVGDNSAISSIQQQLIQQHLRQQKQQQLSQFLQQQQQLHNFPHRSFSQSSNNESLPFVGGATASNSASYLLQTNQTSASQQVAPNSFQPAWKAANEIVSHSSKGWDKGLMGLELSRPITAQALEQLQYLALEKQQRCDSSASLLGGGVNLNGDQSNQLDPHPMGGVREQQLRALLQQEAMRLSALDERQRIVNSAEMIERQKLEELRRRQEKAESLRKLQQQEQLETLKKLKQQQGKPIAPLVNATLNLTPLQRQAQRGSSPNFQTSSTNVNHPLEGSLSFQQHQQYLLQKQVNKSWSLTNQSWMNGTNNGNHVEVNAGAWNSSSYHQQQYHPPPSHPTTTSFANTTSDPNHLLDDPLHRTRGGLFGSTLSSASTTNIWLDENSGPTNISTQQQNLACNNPSSDLCDKSLKESLIMWCESELKDQVPNGNIPSIIQQLLDSSALPEIVNIVKAFFADSDKATGFALGFLDRRSQLMSRQNEPLQQQQSTAVMHS